MRYFLYTLLFIVFKARITTSHRNTEQEQFWRNCQTSSRCGEFVVKFPLSLDSSPSYCSPPGTQLSCIGNHTLLLSLPKIGDVQVTSIIYNASPHYSYILLAIKFAGSTDSCPLRKLSSINLTATPYYSKDETFVFLNCSKNITSNSTSIAGPFSCLSNEHRFVYLASSSDSIFFAPIGCDVVRTSVPSYSELELCWESLVQNLTQGEAYLRLLSFTSLRDCYGERKRIVYSHSKNKAYCLRGRSIELIVGLSVSGLVISIVVVGGILYYRSRKSFKEREVLQKVEKFLENYSSTAPTRYSYADVIKISKRFKHKLGQGGFGSVYKGELSNGIPVAVKILEKYVGEGVEFINEVSTIGRIHHFNIVRLLGFCSEGSRRALVYEFLPNKSLEKHIFSRETKPMSMETINDIATGIARGIEYLHQGCDQRILHFDIKPHNILLDHNFKPKIADFGLAKLCSKEQSMVTMTAIRGTMGYIAPELYSRNFGTVSYKSDVFSFGMLLLEMTSGRRNVDPDVENQSQIYFPEWAYDKLVHDDQELKLVLKVDDDEEVVLKKLVTIAIWCIQWSPADRPSMTKVLQMLTDDSHDLQIPPKPFVSSLDLT